MHLSLNCSRPLCSIKNSPPSIHHLSNCVSVCVRLNSRNVLQKIICVTIYWTMMNGLKLLLNSTSLSLSCPVGIKHFIIRIVTFPVVLTSYIHLLRKCVGHPYAYPPAILSATHVFGYAAQWCMRVNPVHTPISTPALDPRSFSQLYFRSTDDAALRRLTWQIKDLKYIYYIR